MNAKDVLLVQPEGQLQTALLEQLSIDRDFDLKVVYTIAQAIEAGKKTSVDFWVVDEDVDDFPKDNFEDFLARQSLDLPVIVLASSQKENRSSNDGSSDLDYMVKPFRFSALLNRLRLQLRQREKGEDVEFMIGSYQFQPSTKLLQDEAGDKIRLTEKEASILRFLYKSGKEPVGRDVLLHEVWGYQSGVTTHTLETHIYRLRQKIEEDPSNAQLLITEDGGYRLIL